MPASSDTPAGQLRPIHCFHCGANNFVSSDLPPMTTMPCNKCGREIMIPYLLRNFEIRQVIASGGMGTVYRAFDTILKREVAVKLMKRELGRDPKVLDEFYKEARMIAALNHPNVIQVFNFGEMDGENFIAMELADQGSLDSRFKAAGKLSELEVLDVGVKIAGALDAVLKRELIHRDIKPANILYNAENEPKLVDFGLACEANRDPDPDGEVWGTPEFAAPEKFKREPETFRADIYSLGCTLYQALTGQLPFTGDSSHELVKAHLHARVVPPNELVPEVSDDTSELITRMLAKKPRERFENYDELVMSLTAARSKLLVSGAASKGHSRKLPKAARGATGALPAAAPAEQPAPGGGKKLAPLLIAAAAVILVVGIAAFFLFGKGGDTAPVAEQPSAAPVVASAPVGEWIPLSVMELATVWAAPGGRPLPDGWKSSGGGVEFYGSGLSTIASRQSFEGFDMEFEWNIGVRGNQGSVLFALPPGAEQAADALRVNLRPQAPKPSKSSAGALAGLIPAVSNLTVKAAGSFNQSRLVALGNKIEFYLNGTRTFSVETDGNRFKNALESASPPMAAGVGATVAGLVGFELPPGMVIRNARIRAIETWPADIAGPGIKLETLERPATTGPFVNLSGDKSAEQWRQWSSENPPSEAVWKFDSAFITSQPAPTGNTPVATRERYRDFELELEWRAEAGAKCLLMFGLQKLPTNSVNSAYRIALGDPPSTVNKYTVGGLAGLVEPVNPVLRPLGQFNATRLVCFNDKAELWINGARCLSFDINAPEFKELVAKSEYKSRPAFGQTLEGWIGLTPAEGITIRGMRVRPIAQPPQGFATATGKAPAPKAATQPKKKKK